MQKQVKTTEEKENAIVFEKMEHFLIKVTDNKIVARSLQRLITILALTIIRNDNDKNPIDFDHLDDGLYHLQQLIEILQPEKNVA